MIDLSKYTGFDWDQANLTKSLKKHQVSQKESEEIFTNHPRIIIRDLEHSQSEDRYVILGVTNQGRRLTAVFTFRKDKIRIISARNQNRGKERRLFFQLAK
jgi:uncharacterized DUF497 family protein